MYENPKDLEGILAESSLFSSSLTEKGKGGLGKGGLGKGMGKGLVKGKVPPPAPPPAAPKTEEEQLAEACVKVRKMRDVAGTVLAGMQDCVQEAKKAKYWSKNAQKDADILMGKLESEIAALKKVLLKKNQTVDEMKMAVLQVAVVIKECQAACREYKQVAHKSSSVSSRISRKK